MMRRRRLPLAERTALYRFFDAEGQLLYVGITCFPAERFQTHSNESGWYCLHKTVTLEWFETRREAESVERRAIVNEKPAWNIAWANRDQAWLDERDRRIHAQRLAALSLPPVDPNRQRRALEIAQVLAAAPKIRLIQQRLVDLRGRASPEVAEIERERLELELKAVLARAKRRAA